MFKQLKEHINIFPENTNKQLDEIRKSIHDMKLEFNKGI